MAKTIKIKATTASEASKIYSELRDASGEGASTWRDGSWNGHRISYNGKVWFDDAVVFNPYS